MNQKKILHVTFDMGIAGTEQVIVNLVTALDATQYENQLFCMEEPVGELGKKLQSQGFAIHSCMRKPGFDRSVVKKIREVIKKEGIDIVHCHQYSPYVYGLFAGVMSKKPVVFTEHGRLYPDLPSSKRRLVNPVLCRLTKAITVISKATQNALVDIENFPRNKIKVVYNGIHDVSHQYQKDEALFDELGLNDGEFILGTISRLDPIKNQEMMIAAFAEVVNAGINAKLLMVGDGPIRTKLEDLCKILGVQEKVIFTGFQVEPQRYLRLMDIFLLSSLSEGTSMTLLEAMSFSKPCVVTDAGGNPEIVDNEKTGLVTPNENRQAFANATVRLIQDRVFAEELGRKGRERYEQSFSVSAMAEQYSEIYNKISG